jgi:hypothetical protein
MYVLLAVAAMESDQTIAPSNDPTTDLATVSAPMETTSLAG